MNNYQETQPASGASILIAGLGSIAFEAGKKAKERGEKLKNSALKNLRPGCKQYDDFIAGYDES